MKVAVLSDIHGNEVALDAVLEDIERQEIEEIIYLGDLVAKGPQPLKVVNKLDSLELACWLQGNTDMWFEEITEDWEPTCDREEYLYEFYKYMDGLLAEDIVSLLTSLSVEDDLQFKGVDIRCVHGSPRSVIEIMDGSTGEGELKEMVAEVEEDVIVCGHSHRPYIGEIEEKKIINVGSVGSPYDGDNRASYAVLEITAGQIESEIKRVDYNIEKLLTIADKRDFPFLDEYAESLRNGTNPA